MYETKTQKPARKPKSPYKSQHFQHTFDLLSYLAQFGQYIVYVQGVQGIGKTCFIDYFTQATTQHIKSFVVNAANSKDLGELLTHITQSFNQREVAYRDLEEETIDARSWLIVVDDADQLSDLVLNSIIGLYQQNQGPQKQLHLMFFAEQPLKQFLASHYVNEHLQDKFYAVYLSTLNQAETRAFTEYYCQECHLSPPRFSDKNLKLWFEHTGGIPSKIIAKILSSQEWGLKQLAQLTVWHSLPKIKFEYQITLAVVCMIGILVAQGLLSQKHPMQAQQQFVSEAISLPTPQLVMKQPTPAPAVTEPLPQDTRSASQLKTEVPGSKHSAKTQLQPSPHPVKPTQTAIAPPVPAPKQEVTATVTTTHTAHEPTSTHYTMQLLATKDGRIIKQWYNKYHKQYPLRYVVTNKHGQKWHVLLYGEYQTKRLAEQERKHLPHTFDGLHPWIRDIASLQQESTRPK